MRSLLRWATLVILLSLLAAGCGGRASQSSADAGAPKATVVAYGAQVMAGTGEEAYDFTLERLDGGSITLSDLRGGWVLVNFWATWCPPCVKEMPYLDAIGRSRDLAVLGVNMNEPRDRVAAFVEESGVGFPILLDPDDTVKIMYEARALPRTVIVAPDGTVAGVVLGAVSEESLNSWLDKQGVPTL